MQCARRIVDDAHRLGVEARPGEVLVSRQVSELAGGSGLQFSDRGTRRLAGVPGTVHLFAVTGGGPAVHVPRKRFSLTTFDRVVLTAARRAPRALRSAALYANARQRRRSGD